MARSCVQMLTAILVLVGISGVQAQDPGTVTLTPESAQVEPTDRLPFDVLVENHTSASVSASLVLVVEAPGGGQAVVPARLTCLPSNPFPISLLPFSSIAGECFVDLPATVPNGDYSFQALVEAGSVAIGDTVAVSVSRTIVAIAQHTAAPQGDFAILSRGGRVFEVDPRRLYEVESRDRPLPSAVAVHGNTYDDSILAIAADGTVSQSFTETNWADWTAVGVVPCGGVADFAQESSSAAGDFVVICEDGTVWEFDPRRLGIIEARPQGPVGVLAMHSDTCDGSILAVTGTGEIWQGFGVDPVTGEPVNYAVWTRVGTIPCDAVAGFAQEPGAPTADFTAICEDGTVWTFDPCNPGIIEFCTDQGPVDVVDMHGDTWDNSILAVTRHGEIYQALSLDDCMTWTLAGTVP